MAKDAVQISQRKVLIQPPIRKTPINTESIESLTPEKDKNVVGTFVNIECPGQTAKISVKLYRGMEYFCKVFEDNERCTIPLSVARFINERCYHDKHTNILDHEGKPTKGNKPHFRYKFMVEGNAP